jgi:hypothetical protein
MADNTPRYWGVHVPEILFQGHLGARVTSCSLAV